MSARHESHERDADPHDIVPEGFIAAWRDAAANQTTLAESGESWVPMPADEVTTIADALRVAEQAPSTTHPADLRRCPSCGGTRLRHKPGDLDMEHKRSEDWKCANSSCDDHFNNPLPPRSAFDPRAAPRDGAGEPVCPRCGSWRLRSLVRGGIKCLDCDCESPRSVDAGAYVDAAQATLGEVSE